MLTKVVVSGFLAVTAPMVVPAPALAHVTVGVSVGVFHERLSPYGQWIGIGRYGSCWRPSSVAPEWRPYTVGYWAYGDDGWTWESDEAWGWATYHYGRWTYDASAGWAWIPGLQWGPAWVTWRLDAEVVGWAPQFAGSRSWAVEHPAATFWTFVPRAQFRTGVPVARAAYASQHFDVLWSRFGGAYPPGQQR